ncbi:hypothetical protein H6G96_33610 [Nostoc sp. FACHB-892]|uniref:hypothetical protein n=1 Tax=Nostoc sp. FACHB-892 TaxID=2692843 RepID=UPI00168686F3|nr:hypothetical protein [Nostoc sp. FACHB-892]MBD2731122.1 hypothetical protein [Nostoc sp. FACHB-892]
MLRMYGGDSRGLKAGVQRRSRDADYPTTYRGIYQRRSRNLNQIKQEINSGLA